VRARQDGGPQELNPARSGDGEGHHHQGPGPISPGLGQETVDKGRWRIREQDLPMPAGTGGTLRAGPVGDGEGVLRLRKRLREASEETRGQGVVGGGEGINGDVPATLSSQCPDSAAKLRPGDRPGDLGGQRAGCIVHALVNKYPTWSMQVQRGATHCTLTAGKPHRPVLEESRREAAFKHRRQGPKSVVAKDDSSLLQVQEPFSRLEGEAARPHFPPNLMLEPTTTLPFRLSHHRRTMPQPWTDASQVMTTIRAAPVSPAKKAA
jgi:hypothetical protein